MPTDFNGREPDSPTDGEGAMFASTPIWDRQRSKKRGFGHKAAAPREAELPRPSEPRTFAPEPASHLADPPADDMVLTTPTTLASADPVGPGLGDPRPMNVPRADRPIAAPIRTTTRPARKSAGISATALFGGAAVFALIGTGGWFLMQPRDGVPELAPGQPTEVAATPLAPTPSEVDVASNTLPERTVAAPAPPIVRTDLPPVRTARARPAPARTAPSATDSGANASTTVLPDGPQPYSTLNPAAAPTQVTPAAPPPVEAAPPAPIPSTPPAPSPQAAPPPTETPPQ